MKKPNEQKLSKKERAAIATKKWRAKNYSKYLLTRNKWIDLNRDKFNAHNREYRKANKEKTREANAKQRAKRLNRIPKWLTKDDYRFISLFYKEATKLTQLTGIAYEVDHIIPLQGKNVSGLHVPWNLQVITEIENCRKRNKVME